MTKRLLATAACALVLTAQTPAPRAIYTTAQAEAGRSQFAKQQPGKTSGSSCVDCHMASLLGRTGVPPLAGADFAAAWGSRTTKELLARIRLVEPLSDDEYLSLLAYILKVNGAPAGSDALTTATAVKIGAVAK
jgi:cytochrome c553